MSVQIEQIKNGFVNIYLIREPAGLTLIDAGTPGGPKAITRALARRGERLTDVRRVLITHADPDHVGGAAALAALGIPLLAGELEAAALARGEPSRQLGGGPLSPLFKVIGALSPITPVEASEIIVPGQELPILGGLQVLATPGHTPGHVSFYAPRYGVLFAGDSMLAFGGRLSFRDGPVTWDYPTGRESVRLQAALGPRMVCCGHGPVIQGEAIPFPE